MKKIVILIVRFEVEVSLIMHLLFVIFEKKQWVIIDNVLYICKILPNQSNRNYIYNIIVYSFQFNNWEIMDKL